MENRSLSPRTKRIYREFLLRKHHFGLRRMVLRIMSIDIMHIMLHRWFSSGRVLLGRLLGRSDLSYYIFTIDIFGQCIHNVEIPCPQRRIRTQSCRIQKCEKGRRSIHRPTQHNPKASNERRHEHTRVFYSFEC